MLKVKIRSIQHLRAIAALMVVFHHLAWKAEQNNLDFLSWYIVGDAGVDLFFVISGYIMCRTTDDGGVGPLKFLWARVLRIIPLYWVVTTAALVVYIVSPGHVNSSGGTTDLVGSYTLLPSEGKFLVRNGWTLSYEFYFYLIFSIGLLLGTWARRSVPLLFIFLAVGVGGWLGFGGLWSDFLTNPLLLEFAFGMAAYSLLKLNYLNRFWYLVLLLLGVGWLLLTNFGGGIGVRVIDYGFASSFIFIGWVGIDSSAEGVVVNSFGRQMEALGDASYSLYLVHPFGLSLAAIVYRKLGLSEGELLFFFLLSSFSVLSGWLCFRWIEEPLRDLIRRHRLDSMFRFS